MGYVPLSARGAHFVEQWRLLDYVGFTALAAFGADIVRIDVAAAVRAEIRFGLDERTWISDHVDDALVKPLGRDRLCQEFGDTGIARARHALLLGMPGEHDDGDVRIGVGARLADHLRELEAVRSEEKTSELQ